MYKFTPWEYNHHILDHFSIIQKASVIFLCCSVYSHSIKLKYQHLFIENMAVVQPSISQVVSGDKHNKELLSMIYEQLIRLFSHFVTQISWAKHIIKYYQSIVFLKSSLLEWDEAKCEGSVSVQALAGGPGQGRLCCCGYFIGSNLCLRHLKHNYFHASP